MDGNSDTTYSKGSCTHTPSVVEPWWRVDLGQEEPVSEVYVVNRGHPDFASRLGNFEIRVGKLAFLSILRFISTCYYIIQLIYSRYLVESNVHSY